MSFVEDEIAGQPACWRRASALAQRLSGAWPERGARVAVVGCGTSLFVGQAIAALREECGHGETDAFPASERPAGRRYDTVVALSRSGTTTEVLAALGALPRGTATLAITADGHAPLARSARDPMAELVRAQRFAVAAARTAGRDPDRPPHLTRSVVLG